MFAHHPEYARQAELYAKMIKHGMNEQVRACTLGRPIDFEPLQAADIIAYEIRCEEREDGRRRRYPLKRLSELGCTFRISASVD